MARYDWNTFRQSDGTAARLPSSVTKLLDRNRASTEDDPYWEIENYAFVQGQLYEAAEPLVSVLMASLLDDLPDNIKGCVFELIYQIVAGVEDESELLLGNTGLAERCRQRAREGLWLLYKEYRHTRFELVRLILEKIELDEDRFHQFIDQEYSSRR
ncbi:hypothetical protein [Deinococcus sonorensis]|uniref:Immunity protein 30 domain-containing protein n=1 Tax=Deinococcus sonorensis TaxID=309891 RepID=A0ABV8YE01_9DEIO